MVRRVVRLPGQEKSARGALPRNSRPQAATPARRPRSPGVAASNDVLKVADAGLREALCSSESFLLPKDEWPKAVEPGRVVVDPDHWGVVAQASYDRCVVDIVEDF